MIAALSAWHEQHVVAAAALRDVRALPAHVTLEVFSVLTRLPGGLAIPAGTVAEVLAARFDAAPLLLPSDRRRSLVASLAAAGVYGGASYDGLVALESLAHGEMLLTLDARARSTYERLGVPFRDLSDG